MPNLLAQGGFGCVYYPSIAKGKQRKTKPKEFVTKIQINDESAENEIRIGKLIRSFEKYKLFFLPVVRSWNLTIDKRNLDKFKGCDVVTGDTTNYIAMDVPFVAATDLVQELRQNGPHRKVLILLESFKTLLLAVEVLHSLKVVHFDLKMGNILYLKTTHLPRILDFGISIVDPMALSFPDGAFDMTEKLRKLRKHFYAYTVEYSPWCLDIVVLSWIATNREWSGASAAFIAEDYEAKSGLSPSRIQLIKSQLAKYGPLSLPSLVNYLLSQWRTWDAFSIGKIYQEVFSNLMADNTSVFLRTWQKIIGRAISPDPEKRIAAEDIVKQFDDLFLTWNDPLTYEKIVQEFSEHTIITHVSKRPGSPTIKS